MKEIKLRKTLGTALALLMHAAAFACATAPATSPTTDPASAAAVHTVALSAQQRRADFLSIIDRPRVALAGEQKLLRDMGGVQTFHFSFASEAKQRVPGLLIAKSQLLKDGKRHPVVIVLHGTGGKKESEADLLRMLAGADLIAVAIDGRFHGERGNPASYNAAIAQAFVDGKSHPLYFDEVWDVMRLIDYLQSRPDVDPHRIGLMGISKGGIETWLTAAVDPRVAVAIPCISAQSFEWGLENDRWRHRIGTVQRGFDAAAKSAGVEHPDAAFVRTFYDRLIPGIYGEFDCPRMLPLIVPRPLLVISGDRDPINPIEGVRLCEQSTRPVYAAAGVEQQFNLLIQPNTAHAVGPSARAAAVAWLSKWLGP